MLRAKDDALEWRRKHVRNRGWQNRVRGRSMGTMSPSFRKGVKVQRRTVNLRKNTLRDTKQRARTDPVRELTRMRWSSFGRDLPKCRCSIVEVAAIKADLAARRYKFADVDREAVRRIAAVLDSDHSGIINDHEIRVLGGIMRKCPARLIPLGDEDAVKHVPLDSATPTCQLMLAQAEQAALALDRGVDSRNATRISHGEGGKAEVATEQFVQYSAAALEAVMISLGRRASGEAMRVMLRWLERELAAHFGATPAMAEYYIVQNAAAIRAKDRHDKMTPKVHPKPHHGSTREHAHSRRILKDFWNHPKPSVRAAGGYMQVNFGHSTWDPREAPSGQSAFHPADVVSGERPPKMDTDYKFVVVDGRATLRGDGEYVEPIISED